MIKSVTTVVMGLLLLAGSCILPLGDFSLMNDLPSMYRDYCKLRVGDPDVLDFIGDYLMGGKDLLGHNREDRSTKSGTPIQYQHQASISLFYATQVPEVTSKPGIAAVEYPNKRQTLHLSEYHGELLRPPLS
jgi:hypothetical protein